MLIPYRVKTPLKNFPVATITLILINIVVYAFTTRHFLVIRDDIVRGYAFAYGISAWSNFFASSFLHAHILHLVANMFVLWLFGRSVEDRLGIPLYLVVYFGTGLLGAVLQGLFDFYFFGSPQLTVGASGCIMGAVGAYWYLYSWSTVCIYYWFWFIRGVWEVSAFWLVGLYLLMDIVQGIIAGASGTKGGVADFCHVGGGVAGALFCFLIRAKRDNEALAKAKAIQSESRDLSSMPLHALQTMLKHDPGNIELIRAMIIPAIRQGQPYTVDAALADVGPELIDRDPQLVAWYLVDLHGNAGIYRSVHLLRLAGQMERLDEPLQAIAVYRLISDGRPKDPEAAVALYRMAFYYWNVLNDGENAKALLAEIHRRYPHGEMTRFAEGLSRRMEMD